MAAPSDHFHNNAQSYIPKQLRKSIKAFVWETFDYTAYTPDLAPKNYYLFEMMGQEMFMQHCSCYKDVKRWV